MRRLFALSCLALLLSACGGMVSISLILDGRHRFGPETRLPGDLLLRAGSADFAAGSRIEGSVYIFGGTLRMDGAVSGDLIVLDGALILGPSAAVGGDLRLGGGRTERAETSSVHGSVIEGIGLQLPLEERQRGTGLDDALRSLAGALLLAAAGALLSRRPQPLAAIGETAGNYPLVCGASGLLVLLVLPPLMVMMAFTVLLIPLVLIIGLLLVLLLGYGLVALGYCLGSWLGRWWASQRGKQRTVSPAAGTFIGTLLLLLLPQLPWVGEVLALVGAVLILGATLLTRLGTRPYRPPAIVADSAPYKRPGH